MAHRRGGSRRRVARTHSAGGRRRPPLTRTGGGTVIETETGDDGAAYSVEIRLADGAEVEVELDENFDVIGRRQTTTGATRKADED